MELDTKTEVPVVGPPYLLSYVPGQQYVHVGGDRYFAHDETCPESSDDWTEQCGDGCRFVQTTVALVPIMAGLNHAAATAKSLALACNSHAALVAALEAVKTFGSHCSTDEGVSTDYLVESALQKARGED